LLDKLKNDPDHILSSAPDSSGNTAAWKVDIHTGEAVLVEPGRRDVDGWRTDSTGAVVVRYRSEPWAAYIEGRPAGAKDWTQIVKLKEKDFKAIEDFEILGAAESPSQFYVAVKPKDKSEGETRRLRIYDLATQKLSEPIWPALKYDFANIVYDGDTSHLAGVCYIADTYVCDFTDKVMAANFRGLSKFFSGDRNLNLISHIDDGRAVGLLPVRQNQRPHQPPGRALRRSAGGAARDHAALCLYRPRRRFDSRLLEPAPRRPFRAVALDRDAARRTRTARQL